jgi:DNA-binding NarL/FixJ family response regulator
VYKLKDVEYYREVAKRVLDGEFVFPEPKTIPLPQGETPFSDREMEVLRLLCKYMTHQEIADRLFISKKTVDKHIENMREKAQMKSVMELVIYVLSNGWINPNY